MVIEHKFSNSLGSRTYMMGYELSCSTNFRIHAILWVSVPSFCSSCTCTKKSMLIVIYRVSKVCSCLGANFSLGNIKRSPSYCITSWRIPWLHFNVYIDVLRIVKISTTISHYSNSECHILGLFHSHQKAVFDLANHTRPLHVFKPMSCVRFDMYVGFVDCPLLQRV